MPRWTAHCAWHNMTGHGTTRHGSRQIPTDAWHAHPRLLYCRAEQGHTIVGVVQGQQRRTRQLPAKRLRWRGHRPSLSTPMIAAASGRYIAYGPGPLSCGSRTSGCSASTSCSTAAWLRACVCSRRAGPGWLRLALWSRGLVVVDSPRVDAACDGTAQVLVWCAQHGRALEM